MVLEVLLPCDPLGLGVIVFFSNVLFGIFVRLHPQQLEVSHVFFM